MITPGNGDRRAQLLDLNRLPAATVQDMTRDPAAGINGAPPNFGRVVPPHIYTVQGRAGTMARVYRNADEAVRDSITNAARMRNECGIMECLQARQRGTCLLNWHLEPEDSKNEEQKKMCLELTTIIERIPNFMKLRQNLLEALWYGKYGVVLKWGRRKIGGKWRYTVEHWEPRHGDKLVFRYDDGSGRYDPRQMGIRIGAGYELDKAQRQFQEHHRYKVQPTDHGLAYFLDKWERDTLMMVHKHEIEDGPWEDPYAAGAIHGIGIRSRIYWAWYQAAELLAYMVEYVERAALGVEIWPYEYGNPDSYDKTREAAEERIGGGRSIVLVPVYRGEESQLMLPQHIEPGLGGVEALRQVIEDHFWKRIKRYILGQVLTSEAEATGLGSGVADAHLATYADIVKYDATNLEETITTDLVAPLQRLNYPQLRDVFVRFKIDTEADNAAEMLEAHERAWQMGLSLRADDLYDLIGASKPDADDEVIQNPQTNPEMMQQQQASQMAMGGAQMPGQAGVDPGNTVGALQYVHNLNAEGGGYWRHKPGTMPSSQPVFPGMMDQQAYQAIGEVMKYRLPAVTPSYRPPGAQPQQSGLQNIPLPQSQAGFDAPGGHPGGTKANEATQPMPTGAIPPQENIMPNDPRFEEQHPRAQGGQFRTKGGAADAESGQPPAGPEPQEAPEGARPPQAPGAPAMGATAPPPMAGPPAAPQAGSAAAPPAPTQPPPQQFSPVGKLKTLPMLEGATIQHLDDGSAVINAGGEPVRVRTGTPEEFQDVVNANRQAFEHSQQVGGGELPAAFYTDGEVVLREDATPDEMSHELVHAFTDLGLISQQDVATFGGEEQMATAYQDWVTTGKGESEHGAFKKAWDFLASALGSKPAAQRRVLRTIERGQLAKEAALPRGSVDPDAIDPNNPRSAIAADGGLPAASVLFATRKADAWAKNFLKDPNMIKAFGKEACEKFVSGMMLTQAMFGDFSRIPPESAKSPIRPNSDDLFKWTFDSSTVCPQQDQYVAVIGELQQHYGRILNQHERMLVGKMMQENGATPACWYCYGQSARDKVAKLVTNAQDVFEKVWEGQEDPDSEYNKDWAEWHALATKKRRGKRQAARMDELHTKLRQTWRPASKTSKPWSFWNTRDPKNPKFSQMAAFLQKWKGKPEAKELFLNHPGRLHDIVNGYRQPANDLEREATAPLIAIASVSQVNKPKPWSTYKEQFLNEKSLPQSDIDYVNGVGGFRFNSQTDFRPWHALETAQALSHLATRGGMAHAYTRQPEFVEMFGNTGMKFNLSVGYATNPDGSLMLGDDGNPLFDMIGMERNKALELRRQYKNAGTMLVPLNHDQVLAGLNDENIDMMIPYHAGSVPQSVDAFHGATNFEPDQYEDWSDFVAENGENARKTIITKDGRTITVKAGEHLTRVHHDNDREVYLDICDQLGIVPRFPQYCGRAHQIKSDTRRAEVGGNNVDHPNYMKMVRDVAANPSEQQVVDISKIDWDRGAQMVDEYIKQGGTQHDVQANPAVVQLVKHQIDTGKLPKSPVAPEGSQPPVFQIEVAGQQNQIEAEPQLSTAYRRMSQPEKYGRVITGDHGYDPFARIVEEHELYQAEDDPGPLSRSRYNYQDTPNGENQCSNCKWFKSEGESCTLFAYLNDAQQDFDLDANVETTGWCSLHTDSHSTGNAATTMKFAMLELDRMKYGDRQKNIFGQWEEADHPRGKGGQFAPKMNVKPPQQKQFWTGLDLLPGQQDFLEEGVGVNDPPQKVRTEASIPPEKPPEQEVTGMSPRSFDKPDEASGGVRVAPLSEAPHVTNHEDSYYYVKKQTRGRYKGRYQLRHVGLQRTPEGFWAQRDWYVNDLGEDYDKGLARAKSLLERRNTFTLYADLHFQLPKAKAKSSEPQVSRQSAAVEPHAKTGTKMLYRIYEAKI